MKDLDIKIDLGTVQETLMIPLWARAEETRKSHPIINDPYAKDIVAKIEYDFSKIGSGQTKSHQLVWPIRAYNFDDSVQKFLAHNTNSAVVNIGAGLDTTFQRIDDGRVLWINLDLPDVVTLRQKLIPDSEREITIAKSVFDYTWINDIAHLIKGRTVLFMAAGVFCYFERFEIESLFRKLADTYPSAHVLFDAMSSKLWVSLTNRAVLRQSGMDSSVLMKWYLKKASHLRKWMETIKVIEQYSMFSRIPIKDGWSKKLIWEIKMAGRLRMYKMMHVQL